MPAFALLLLAALLTQQASDATPVAVPPALASTSAVLSLRITSPLGRTGIPGTIRIVAQLQGEGGGTALPVYFYVDGQQIGVDSDGAPYAVEWVDENPFERRVIDVAATDSRGGVARDRVVLDPLEITEETRVTSVVLEASVQDKRGRFVRGITAEQFQLFEDGVRQDLEMVQQQEVGATLAMLVDSSASMSRRIDFVRRTAASLAARMGRKDRMIVAPFAKKIGATTGPSADAATITQAIDAIRSMGGTAIYDSLVQICEALETNEGRRAILLITDGYDEHSATKIDAAIEAVRRANAAIYVVAIGGIAGISLEGERNLKRLAGETGGRYYSPVRDEQLSAVHDALTSDLSNSYVIAYTPQNQTIDGAWRKIELRTSVPDHTIRTRPGYFAPRPAPIKAAIEFTVLDQSGKYLDVSADDLAVAENGIEQKIESFQEATQPLSVVLALDASGSMKGAEQQVMEAARGFVASMRPGDKVAVMMFDDTVDLTQDFTTLREFTLLAIDKYRVSGGTALYDAIGDSLGRLARAEGRKVVVVMTDGRDENAPGTGPGSIRRFDEVLAALKSSNATVFGIGLGSKVDRAPLEQLADASGGRALFPADVSELAAEYRRVAEDLRRRYVVGFTSSHVEHDGTWREVTIRLKSAPGAIVRSVGGYFAPGS